MTQYGGIYDAVLGDLWHSRACGTSLYEVGGCTVGDLWMGGGKDGMVHISQICQERIETIEPHVNIGDEVIVKVIKIDDKGRINLTIKGVTEEDKAKLQA